MLIKSNIQRGYTLDLSNCILFAAISCQLIIFLKAGYLKCKVTPDHNPAFMIHIWGC